MVEFGLKLQDNQVAEWSEHYIAYEDLKKLLKKVKQALARYEEQAKKKPELAAEIKSNYAQGISTFITRTPPISSASLTDLKDAAVAAVRRSASRENLSEAADATETTSLLQKMMGQTGTPTTSEQQPPTTDAYASTNSLPAVSPESASAIHGVLKTAVSSVSGYFEKRYESSLRETLRDIDAFQDDFDQKMMSEAERINAFYDSKLEELEKRLSLLTENVIQSVKENSQEAGKKSSGDPNFIPISPGPAGTTDDSSKHVKHPSKPSMDWRELVARITRKQSSAVSDPERSGDDRKWQAVADVDELDEMDADDPHQLLRDKSAIKKIAEADSIQRALVDQYRQAKLLHNYAIMNYTGFVKIVKKHDKTLKERKGRYKTLTQGSNICDEGRAVERLAKKLELRYANWFCDGNHREAYAQLLPKRGDGLEADWSQLRLGYRMGMCAVLGLWVCWDCVWGYVRDGYSTIGGRTAFPVFRACGGLLILQWCWGASVFIWTRYRVNYIYLFDFDPRIVSSPTTLFNEAVDNTLFFLVIMLLYYKAGAHEIPDMIPSGVFPFLLVVYTVAQLIFPLRTRVPMWNSIWQVVTAPSHSPSFYHGYVGDIFTSMVKVFQDIAWTICFLVSGDWLIDEDLKESTRHVWAHSFWYKNVLIPVICLLPLLFRFNQCLRKFLDTGNRFPHLANAAKYALSQTVTLFGAFHPLYMMHKDPNHHGVNLFQVFWMAVFVASSLYSFSWDVFMDWGLGRAEYQGLGPRLMYPNRTYYYYVIALDLVLRFMWVLTLLPPQSGAKFEVPNYLTALVMMLELFRRTIWGFLRLENEHRSNTAGFRRVSFVPLHFNTGHNHKYKQESEHRGMSVLAEVAAVAAVVILVCVYSVVAAQRATRTADSGNQEL